jgi:hypothetical protein
VDNVGMKTCLFGDLKLHGYSHMFSLVETEVVPGRVQQPITNFTRWDDFMVHGVNNLDMC